MNQHDHILNFVDEVFIRDPSGFCSHSALSRCYEDWCAQHDIVNRKLPFLLFLAELERRFGVKAKMAHISEDRSRTLPGEYERSDGRVSSRVYVIVGLRFRHRELNLRPSPDARVPPAKVWRAVAQGTVLDTIEPVDLSDDEIVDDGDDDDNEEHLQKRRDYYARNKDRILAQKAKKR